RPAEDERRAVIDAVAAGQRPVGDQPVVERPALLLAVVVGDERASQHTEPVAHRPQLGPERVGRESLEPTHAARGHAAHHNPALPPRAPPPATPPLPTPAVHAASSARSTPCWRQIASMFTVLPPPMNTRSWSSRNASMS